MVKTRTIAAATLERMPRRENPMPSGAAMNATTKQVQGSAMRYLQLGCETAPGESRENRS